MELGEEGQASKERVNKKRRKNMRVDGEGPCIIVKHKLHTHQGYYLEGTLKGHLAHDLLNISFYQPLVK